MSEHNKEIYENFSTPLKNFYNFHGVQMYGCGFPMQLVEKLYGKLANAIYDVGEYF